MSSTDVSDPELSSERDSAVIANNETKIILVVVCLLGMVAIGAEVWFHFSKQDAIEEANALRVQLATQVPIKSAETDQAILQPLDEEPVAPATVPAVTTLQFATPQTPRKQITPAGDTQHQSKTMEAKVAENQPPSTPTPATKSSRTSEDISESGLPPVSDRTGVIASARTGGSKRGVRSEGENNATSERSVWQQLKNDMKQHGGKADFCSDAVRSLNQCP